MRFRFPEVHPGLARQNCSILFAVVALLGCNDYAEREGECTQLLQLDSDRELTLSSAGTNNRPGWFALFRQAKHLCAIRLSNVRTTSDPVFGCADYEWYSWLEGEKDQVERGSGKLSHFSDKGAHGFSIPQGRSKISCGDMELRWIFPTRLLPAHEFQPSPPIEYALTAWESMDEVNALDSRLVWMAYDVEGKSLRRFPPEELPR